MTNAQFKQFVDATGYKTVAERGLDPKTNPNTPSELLVPGSVVFVQPTKQGGRATQWWQYSLPAPTGASRPVPAVSIAGKENHPVVHIAPRTAPIARWRGRSLPTEAQWEFAARGGRDGEDDWSSAFDARGSRCEHLAGLLSHGSADDGYAGTAPVGCFKANGVMASTT